ncbi:MAG: PQQ-binding-like beta-propeller repeat protein [Methanotrichaceae archaeon]
MKKILLLALTFLLAIVVVSAQDWPIMNYDSAMSRHSPQTVIGKDNVNQLQVKWILNTNFTIENPPLIIGDTGYTQTNAIMQVIAFDLNTGLTKWKYTPYIPTIVKLPRSASSHGMAYENGVIYAPTGSAGGIVALDATSGKLIWNSGPIRPLGGAFRISAPPLIWKNYVIAGSALGDAPPFGMPNKGSVTALDKATGKILWTINTTEGEWVTGKNASVNGGASAWSGGAIDTEKGIVYIPTGNPAPDFYATTRPPPNLYANHVMAINITDGKVLWATPFVSYGTVLNVTLPDTHDWDTTWGTNLMTAEINGTAQKIVIGHNKRGDIMAMNATTGKPIWWKNLAILYMGKMTTFPNGTTVQLVWPGSGDGIEDYTAFDNSTIYAAVSNQGYDYIVGQGSETIVKPNFTSMTNGIGNGSIVALDPATGKTKWKVDTPYPTYCSPLVTNGVVFAGHLTSMGVPYNYSTDFGGPTESPQISTGILMALDADTGKELWEFNVGAPVGIGGPSIGNGMLLVPTGSGGQVTNAGGYIVAFGLPGNRTSSTVAGTIRM